WRRSVARASSIPSIPGIFTSLKSKSKSPLDALRGVKGGGTVCGFDEVVTVAAQRTHEESSNSVIVFGNENSRHCLTSLQQPCRARLQSAPSHRLHFRAATQSDYGNPVFHRGRGCCGPAMRS